MNTSQAKTIQIFLPTGDPTGIRIAEQTTSIMRVIEVPRADISRFLEMDEAKQVGLYFLVGGDARDEVYIGQSSEVGRRLLQHIKENKKDWERALILVSLTQNLTQTHVLYLEYISIEKAKECQRVRLINGNNGQKPHTPTPLQADCEAMHEIARMLLTTLGYPFFKPLDKSSGNGSEAQPEFFCTRSGVQASANYTNEGMVVLKGSSFPHFEREDASKHRLKFIEKRDELLQEGVLQRQGDRYVFMKDLLFPSPSAASSLLVQNNSNGWTDFKTADGTTLSDAQERALNV